LVLALLFFFSSSGFHCVLHSFPTRRSSDLFVNDCQKNFIVHFIQTVFINVQCLQGNVGNLGIYRSGSFYLCKISHTSQQRICNRSEEHTSELQSRENLVCRLLLEKKKQHRY